MNRVMECLLLVLGLIGTGTAGLIWDHVLEDVPILVNALHRHDADRCGGQIATAAMPGFTLDQLQQFEREPEVCMASADGKASSPNEWRSPWTLPAIAKAIAPSHPTNVDAIGDDPYEEQLSEEVVEAAGHGSLFETYTILRHLVTIGTASTNFATIVERHADRLASALFAVARFGPKHVRRFLQRALPEAPSAVLGAALVRAMEGPFLERLANLIVGIDDPDAVLDAVHHMSRSDAVIVSESERQKRFLWLAVAGRMAEFLTTESPATGPNLLDRLLEGHLATSDMVLALQNLAPVLGADRLTALFQGAIKNRKKCQLPGLNVYLIRGMFIVQPMMSTSPFFSKITSAEWRSGKLQKLIRAGETQGLDGLVNFITMDEMSEVFNLVLKKIKENRTMNRDVPNWIRAMADLGRRLVDLKLDIDIWEVIEIVPANDDRTVANLFEAAAIAYSRVLLDEAGELPSCFGNNLASALLSFDSVGTLDHVTDRFWTSTIAALSLMSSDELNDDEPYNRCIPFATLIDPEFENRVRPDQRPLYLDLVALVNLRTFVSKTARIDFIRSDFDRLFVDHSLNPRHLRTGLTGRSQQKLIEQLLELLSAEFLATRPLDELHLIACGLRQMTADSLLLTTSLIRGLMQRAKSALCDDLFTVAAQMASLAGPGLGQHEVDLLLDLVLLDLGLSDAPTLDGDFFRRWSQAALLSALRILLVGEIDWGDEVSGLRDALSLDTLDAARPDFTDLSPPIWAGLYGPLLINALRADLFGVRVAATLSYWLPGAAPDPYLAEVMLAAGDNGRHVLLDLMTDSDTAFLLTYLLPRSDLLAAHRSLTLRLLRRLLGRRYWQGEAVLFGAHETGRSREKARPLLVAILRRVLEQADSASELSTMIAVDDDLEADNLALLVECVAVAESAPVFRNVLAVAARLPAHAVSRPVVAAQPLLTWLLRHGLPECPLADLMAVYDLVHAVIVKMASATLADVVLVLAQAAARHAQAAGRASSARLLYHTRVPLQLQFCLHTAASGADRAALARLQQQQQLSNGRRKRKRQEMVQTPADGESEANLVRAIIAHASTCQYEPCELPPIS